MDMILFRNFRFLAALITIVLVFTLVSSISAQELNDPLSYPFYDPESGGTSCRAQTANSGPGVSGRIFMVGDSVTDGARAELEQTLQSATINAVHSRGLSRGSSQTDGQSILENSDSDIQANDVVIVALGTNSGLTTANIQAAVTAIKQANSAVRIFWVNIGANNAKRTNSPLAADGWNATLDEFYQSNRDQLNGVIDWASVVAQNPDYINDDGYGVHLSESGRQAFAQTIAAGLAGGQASGTGNCQLLPGNDNAERIWNFFIARGWQPWIVAGIIGNMSHESGLEPMRLQSTPSGRETPSVNAANSRAGWGLVQWTPAGKIINGSRENGIAHEEIDTLEFQLQFLYEQLTGTGIGGRVSSEKGAGDHLLATTTVEAAAISFAQEYERCANCDSMSHIQPRIDTAIDILNRFGSGTGVIPL